MADGINGNNSGSIEATNDSKVNKIQKQADSVSLINGAKDDYVFTKMESDQNYFDLDNFITDNIAKDFGSYISTINRYSDFSADYEGFSLDQKKTIVSQIKQLVLQEHMKISKNRETLLATFESDFDLDKQNKEKLIESISEITTKNELRQLLKSEIARLKYVKNNGITVSDSSQQAKLIDEIGINNIKSDDLTTAQQQAIMKFSQGASSLSSQEYLTLLGAFPLDAQKKILSFFVVNIELSDLVKKGIIKKDNARNIIKEHMLDSIKNGARKVNAISEEDFNNSFNEVTDFEGFFITTSDLSQGDHFTLLNDSSTLKKVFDEINEFQLAKKKAVDNDFESNIELDQDGNIHGNFIDLIKTQGKDFGIDSTLINSISNFYQGGYLRITIEGVENYYYIGNVDLGSTKYGKAVKMKNLYSGYGNKIKNKSVAPSELYTYNSLLKLFESSSIQENKSIEFISPDDFEKVGLIESDPEDNISTEKDLLEKIFSLKNQDSLLNKNTLTDLCFLDKTGEPATYRHFESTNDSTQTLTLRGSGQKLSYSDFFSAVKEGVDLTSSEGNKKVILEKSFSTADETFGEVEGLHGLTISSSGDKLVPKELKDDKSAEPVTYLVSKKQAIYINKISDNEIEYTFGELKNEDDEDEKNKKRNFVDKYSAVSWNQFAYDVKNYKLQADTSENEKNIQNKNGKGDKLEQTGGIFGAWMQWTSLSQVFQGGEMFMGAFKEHMERGDRLKAAKIAEKMGFILPEEAKEKLKSTTEGETKKLINELVDELKGRKNSPAYIKKNILGKRHAQPWEIYAGMIYMLEKTGTLTGKKLAGQSGEFEWYKKMGGTVGDSFFNKEKSRALRSDGNDKLKTGDAQSFTEEGLMMSWLMQDHVYGKLFERAGKDFGNSLAKGTREEMEDGENKTGDKNSITEKVEYFKEVLEGNEQANAIGSLKKLLGKNTDAKSMNAAPFMLLSSGICERMNPPLINQIVGMAFGGAYAYLRFGYSPALNAVFNDSIYHFLKDSGKSDTAESFRKTLSMPLGKDKIKALSDLWENHGGEIQKFIGLSDGKAHLEALKGKEPYTKFFNTLKGVYSDGEFSVPKDQLDSGVMDQSGLGSTGGQLNAIISDTSGGFGPGESRKTAGVYFKRLEQIKENSALSEDEKKKLFIDIYDKFEERIRAAVGSSWGRADITQGGILQKFQLEGLIFHTSKGGYNYGGIERSDFLEKAFEKYMEGSRVKSGKRGADILQKISDNNSDFIGKVMNGEKINPANNSSIDYHQFEEDFQQAA